MIERTEAWFRGRTKREQWLLLAMVGLLAIVILWLGIIRPLDGALASARERHTDAVTTLGRVEADADALRRLGRSRLPRLEAPLATVVSGAAATNGFGTAGVTPQGSGRVTVTIASARPPALFGLVAELARRGVIVERFSARASAEQTLAVDMTLTGRAR